MCCVAQPKPAACVHRREVAYTVSVERILSPYSCQEIPLTRTSDPAWRLTLANQGGGVYLNCQRSSIEDKNPHWWGDTAPANRSDLQVIVVEGNTPHR